MDDPENAAELARFKRMAEEWGRPGEEYEGPTHDIDLNKEWYCPQCCDGTKLLLTTPPKTLMVSSGKRKKNQPPLDPPVFYESLYCPTYYEICEYGFENIEARRARGVWWSKGYQYPLSRRDLDLIQLRDVERRIKAHRKGIEDSKRAIVELEAELLERKAALLG